MTRLSTLLIITTLYVNTAMAQSHVTLRQQNFPVDLPTEDDNVEWRRDIYREVNLAEDENAGLYCPQEPTEYQQGLFTRIFSLAIERKIPIYRYNIDGNEVFNDNSKVDIKDILSNHHIFFEENDSSVIVNMSDVPAAEVLTYYIKESVFYDLTNSAFRIRVTALCPVLIEDDDFNDGTTRYPLFWVRYKDLEPYLKSMPIIPDYRNSARVVSMADYFTRNLYKGEIYKVSNALGKTLRQMAGSDSAMKVMQQRIENDLRKIRITTYNTYYSPTPPKTFIKQQEKPARKPLKFLFWQKKEAIKNETEQIKDTDNETDKDTE